MTRHPDYRTLFSVLSLLVLLVAVESASAATLEEIQASLLDQLGYNPSAPFVVESTGTVPSNADPQIVNVYRENGFEPLWVDDNGPTVKATVLLSVLKKAESEGLDPADYQTPRIESQWGAAGSKEQASIDILLTAALHAYVSDLREGRLDPCLLNPDLFTCARDRRIDPVELTMQAMAAPDLGLFLQDQAPDSSQYKNLRNMLHRYREIENKGGWSEVPKGLILEPGMSDPRVPLIVARLAATGYLPPATPSKNPFLYDDETVDAVMQFQEKHGLEVDGIIGQKTRNTMNIPVSSIIRQILINMERLRWLSRGAGERYVMVNIASFSLMVVDGAQIVLDMPVIVGKNYRKTPVFSDSIAYIEFNPFWNIPPSIARDDILSKIIKDPSYLSRMGIHVFDGWKADSKELLPETIQWDKVSKGQMATFKLRQNPGPNNFLGRVKFMFPNRFAVYLHDTPAQELFQHAVRTFSSGCIRLSKPIELATLLLETDDSEWNAERILQTVDSGKRTVVKLQSPLPIHIVYLTVYTDLDGCVCFKKDIYGRDKLLLKALYGS